MSFILGCVQKPSLGSRFWNKMHLWKSEGQAAADKLARSFTADRSFGSRGSGAVDSIPPLCIVMLVAGTRGDVQVSPPDSSEHMLPPSV